MNIHTDRVSVLLIRMQLDFIISIFYKNYFFDFCMLTVVGFEKDFKRSFFSNRRYKFHV